MMKIEFHRAPRLHAASCFRSGPGMIGADFLDGRAQRRWGRVGGRWFVAASLGFIGLHEAGFAQALSADQLDTLVVTGSQLLEPLKHAPVRTEVFDAEFIDRSGARNLAEVVESSPGVRIETNCTNCNTQQIQMLGLSQAYVGILFDGLPNFTGLAGVYGIEQIPAGLLGGIEVVKGGGSVLYGPNAVAGVVNLLPRNPYSNQTQLSYRLGAFTEGDAFGEGPSSSATLIHDLVSQDLKVRASVFYNRDYVMPVDLTGDGFTNISRRQLDAAGVRIAWDPGEDQTFSVDYQFSNEDRRGGDAGEGFFRFPNTNILAEELFSRRNVTTLKWDGRISDRLSGTTAYSYARTARQSYYGGLAAFVAPDGLEPDGTPFWNPGRTTGLLGFGDTLDELHFVNGLLSYQAAEKHRLTIGSQYRHEIVNDTAALNLPLADTFSNLGLLGQHRYTPNETWTLEYGARVDVNSELQDPVFLPRGSLLWTMSDAFRVRSAVSTGFRAPEIFDEDLHVATVGGENQVIRNAAGLFEESSVTYSLSPEWQIDDHWRAEASLYHTSLADTFGVGGPDSGGPGIQLRENVGDSAITGGEINVGHFRDEWSVVASWVEQRLEYADPFEVFGAEGAIDAVFTEDYVRAPESLGQVLFTHQGRLFDTYLACRLTGPMDVPRQVFDKSTAELRRQEIVASDWFANMDVGLRKTFHLPDRRRLVADVTVRNLVNSFQDDLDVGAFRDPNYIYGPAFPRSVFVGLRLEF